MYDFSRTSIISHQSILNSQFELLCFHPQLRRENSRFDGYGDVHLGTAWAFIVHHRSEFPTLDRTADSVIQHWTGTLSIEDCDISILIDSGFDVHGGRTSPYE